MKLLAIPTFAEPESDTAASASTFRALQFAIDCSAEHALVPGVAMAWDEDDDDDDGFDIYDDDEDEIDDEDDGFYDDDEYVDDDEDDEDDIDESEEI